MDDALAEFLFAGATRTGAAAGVDDRPPPAIVSRVEERDRPPAKPVLEEVPASEMDEALGEFLAVAQMLQRVDPPVPLELH
jgi:hypothetical protein